jgi:hypothetical protein
MFRLSLSYQGHWPPPVTKENVDPVSAAIQRPPPLDHRAFSTQRNPVRQDPSSLVRATGQSGGGEVAQGVERQSLHAELIAMRPEGPGNPVGL